MSSLPDPHSLAILQAENRYESIGYWIGENAPRFFEAAQNPFYMALGVAGLVGVVGTGVTVRAAVPAFYYKALRGLAESEAAITWGYREQRGLDHYTRLPIPGLWKDRTAGVQFIAPTRQGKTQGLLPIVIQDLEAGRDVLIIEISGDLGTEAEKHARARGAEVLKVDPSDSDALAFNPIYAANNQKAGQKAAAVMKAVATNHPHYSSMNQNLARFFTILARDHKRHHGRDPNEANLAEVRTFVQNHDHLRSVLGAYEGEDKQTHIEAAWLSSDAAEWIEQSFLRWRSDYRENTISGFVAYLNNLLSAPAARECLCPEPGKEVLDLSREVSDEAADPALPEQTGRLIMLRFPIEALDGDPAADTAYWALKTVIDTTRAGRSVYSTPLSVIQDELPTLVGDASEAALKDYQLWITNIGKFNVASHVAYQGWDLLPNILEGTLRSNGRNIFISGGMSGQDAKRAQIMLGSELEEDVSQQEELGSASRRRRRSVSVKEKPRYSIGEIQKIPRGQWWLLRFHRGKYRDPIVIRVPMAKLPREEAGEASPQSTEQSPEKGPQAPPASGHNPLEASGAGDGLAVSPLGYSLPGTTNALRPPEQDENPNAAQPDADEGGAEEDASSENSARDRSTQLLTNRKGGG